ncbi:MAG: FAD-dependent oxidoreductase [Candidatus Omnitrophica bacterium]|nr:FAD-dependent oxidoreductase [Candidatus Omnitrophota bacterium]
MIKLNIDGKIIETESTKIVLEAALESGIYIPNLCYHPDLTSVGACRLCIVEIEGMKGIPTSCTTLVKDGMVVRTDSEKLKELRKNILWLILSEHPQQIKTSSQLQKVADWIGIKQMVSGYTPHSKNIALICDDPLFNRDLDRCILCGRCVRICQEVRKAGVLGFINRGIKTTVGTSLDLPLKDAGCVFCTACVEVCPSLALVDKEEFDEKERQKVLLPCTNTCPAGIDAARYVRLIAEEKYQDALEVIREKVPFPKILGYVCDHPCEEACRRGQVNEPIAIRALKRFVAEKDTRRWRAKIKISPASGKRIAIVGSGPAGLTCAWYLKKLGHTVVVFEALSEAGGMMRAGIPRYRLPRKILDQEIKEIKNIGVEIKTSHKIGSTQDLFSQGFAAIFLALGCGEGIRMGVPGEDDPRVLDGIAVLRAINSSKKADICGEVAVVGGGNVAIDVARTALRMGAKKVSILYRRTRQEMPACSEEVEEALKEGVKISFLVAPQKIISGGKKLKIECIRMELGEPDASGRRRPVPVQGSEFIVKSDRLILAIGQKATVPQGMNNLLNRKGWIEADPETLVCSVKGVFAGGDLVSGPASVIEAIAAGKIAASAIDKYIGGLGVIEEKLTSAEIETACLGRKAEFAHRKRTQLPMLAKKKRLKGFEEVEFSLTKNKAVEEAKRCLRCELRLKISKAPLPPST